MADVRTLAGRSRALEIFENVTVAYWRGETPDEPGFHLGIVHEEFAKMAEELGYRIERIQPEEAAA